MKYETLLKAFDYFRQLLNQYFPGMPVDLQQTLDEIRDYIVRNKHE